MMRAWGSRERCKSMPMWKDSKGGHAIRAPRGKVIATAYRPRRQALHKEPRTPIYKRETMHIRLATTWHMCAPDCHGALFLRTRRPSWTPSEGYAQSGRINIGIAAGNREEYAIPQSSRNALRGRPFRPSATDWGLRRLVQHSAGHVSMGAGCVSMNLKLYGRQPCPPTRVGDSCSTGGL